MFIAVPVWLVFTCIILYRWLVNHVLWKVRNRLIVTYLLMGLAPGGALRHPCDDCRVRLLRPVRHLRGDL